MSTLVKVARYHLVQPWQYLVVPWGILTFSFLVSLVVYVIVPADHHTVMTAHGAVSVLNSRYTGASSSFFIWLADSAGGIFRKNSSHSCVVHST